MKSGFFERCLSSVLTFSLFLGATISAVGNPHNYEFVVLKTENEQLHEAQINNAGKIVFVSSSSIFYGDETGVAPIAIANGLNPGIEETLVDVSSQHVSINDRGSVAFVGFTIDSKAVLYSLEKHGWKKRFEAPSGVTLSDPTINNAGDILVQFGRAEGGEGFYMVGKNSTNVVVEIPSLIDGSLFTGLANENDLNARGQFLFQAQDENGSRSIFFDNRGNRTMLGNFGTFTLNNAGFVAVADSSGVRIVSPERNRERFVTFDPMMSVALADSAIVAYSDGETLRVAERCDRDNIEIIETTLLSVGDPIDGSPVSSINLYRRAITPAGEIVFSVVLEDGRNVVLIAKR